MPKLSGKINQRERDICARVKEIREGIKWSQPDFAKHLDLTKNQLASIEYGRTPLRFEIGIRLCNAFDIAPAWLVTGMGAMHPYCAILLYLQTREQLAGNDLFSAVHDLQPNAFYPDAEPPKNDESPIEPASFERAERILRGVLSHIQDFTTFKDAEKAQRFARELDRFVSKHLAEYVASGAAVRVSRDKAADMVERLLAIRRKKSVLTDSETLSSLAEVKPQLPSLLERLKKATAQKGKKSELAEYLQRVTKENVPLASVSRWLSGEREPGGEVALLLLKWVELQERKT